MRFAAGWLVPTLGVALLGAVAAPGAARPAGAYEAVQVADGGTIQGKVTFAGTPPPKKKVIPTKDREACGSSPRDVDQIVLGSDKTVAEAVVYLQKVEKGKAWEKAGQARRRSTTSSATSTPTSRWYRSEISRS